MAKVYFNTLGCRLNQAEAERLAQGFILAGHEVVDSVEAADLQVVNTCTVTHAAGAKSRRSAQPAFPGQRVIVTGCHSEVRPEDFADADLVVSNADKEELVVLAQEKLGMDGLALGLDYRRVGPLQLYPLALEHTRAFVKVQDGCNLRCTFCMTTIARGASHSRAADEVVQEVKALSEKGCHEVVLTGVHAGSYLDETRTDLGGLIERVLEETPIGRVRLSSLEPWNFQKHWLKLWPRHGRRLCRHLHMSLQSGSDSVLRRMARAYDSATYAEKVDLLRNHIPDLAVTTDIIVGFPGETDTEHKENLAFIERMAFADAHIFTFSPRPGTEAALMPDQVPKETRTRRFKEVEETTNASAEAYRSHMLGKTFDVLWERREAGGLIAGLTDTYLRVRSSSGAEPNSISSVRLGALEKGTFQAENLEAVDCSAAPRAAFVRGSD